MGLLICCLVLTALLLYLAFLFDCKYDGASIACGIAASISALISIILLVGIIGTIVSAPKRLESLQYQSYMYQELIDNVDWTSSNTQDVYRLYTEVVDFNQQIVEYRNKSTSVWLYGLYSPLWKEVSLVQLNLTD